MRGIRRLTTVAVVTLFLWGTGGEGGAAAEPPIEVEFLVTPEGESLTSPVAVNEGGQVAAVLQDPEGSGQDAALWDDGVVTVLDRPWVRGRPSALSSDGQVVGMAALPSGGRYAFWPFSWSGGQWTWLPAEGGLGTAVDVNDQGQVLGALSSAPGYGPDATVVWDDGQLVTAPEDADVVDIPAGINDQGQVAVNVEVDGERHAAVWEVGGGVTDLGTLGGSTSRVVAINEAGHVLGNSTTSDGDLHAFLWRDGEMTDLGTLGGAQSDGRVLNDLGDVAGTSTTADGRISGFLWRDGEMTDLGTLGGSSVIPATVPEGLSNRGQVVGRSETADGDLHAFLWRDGEMTDLGELAGEGSSRAVDVNDSGQVLGALSDAPVERAVVWTVPSS